MDEVDISLCKMLNANSRAPYRDLADRLGLSINAVHKRIQNLVDLGIIDRFRAMTDSRYFSPIITLINGRADVVDLEAAIERIGEDPRTYRIIVAGGDVIYVHGIIRDLGELDDYVAMVRNNTDMDDPLVGVAQPPSTGSLPELSRLDYRIVKALKEDSRRPLTEVAEEVNTSIKTVRRRLKRMVDAQAIRMCIDFEPTASGDIVAFVHAVLKDGGERDAVVQDLVNNFQPSMLGVSYMQDHPDLLFITLWAKSMKELKEQKAKLMASGKFRRMVINIFFESYEFESWTDTELDRRGSGQ
jgi:Lrp/AsnC family leucine-responsive transcriptional regulator